MTKTIEDDSKVEKTLASEIGSAVESAISDDTKNSTPEESSEVEVVESDMDADSTIENDRSDSVSESDDDSESNSQDGKSLEDDDLVEEAPKVSDDLLTRAIRAGMSMGDAKSFTDPGVLERQIDRLEGTSEEGEIEDASEAKPQEEDPLASFPELDPDIYDENIVEGFKALKELVAGQNATIKELTAGSQQSAQQLFMDKQVDVLAGVGITPTSEQRNQLNETFDVLKAGYEARGKEVADEQVFDQAASMIFGDETQKVATDQKASKAAKRSKMKTQRPGGSGARASGDPVDEIGKLIDQKFGN